MIRDYAHDKILAMFLARFKGFDTINVPIIISV